MFGIGASEFVVIGIILIIAVGPQRMPGMLKALARAYREFRRATRELRASTGIDEILQDEDLRALRRPLEIPPAIRPTTTRKPLRTPADREQESPPEGVDIAEIRSRERRVSAPSGASSGPAQPGTSKSANGGGQTPADGAVPDRSAPPEADGGKLRPEAVLARASRAGRGAGPE